MILLLVQASALYVASFFLWKTFRKFFTTSDLDNIPGPPSKSFLKGVLPDIFNPDAWKFHQDIAEKYGGIIKIKGMLGENQLYVFDPKALHNIVVKNQSIYEKTIPTIDTTLLIFGRGLLGTIGMSNTFSSNLNLMLRIAGDQHRKQRKMLNPVFSITHMREMIPTFYEIGHKLEAGVTKEVQEAGKEIDVLSWFTRTALELIGQSGLGYSFDPLSDSEESHRYAGAVKGLAPLILKTAMARMSPLGRAVNIGTPKFRRFVLDIIPWPAGHEMRDVIDLMHETSVEIYEEKKEALAAGDEALQHQVARGKDIMSILMKANLQASENDQLSEEEVISQMSTLIFAAMDTTSNALSRTLWVLSQHQNVQQKLRAELREAMDGKESLDYDELHTLPYMDAVIREVLRLYPPLPMIARHAIQDNVLPLSTPIKGIDGKEMNEIFVPKNTVVYLSIMACNRNPELWGPDADEFKPERWLNPLPQSITDAHIPGVYSNLMTFHGGGRSCIGFKFSQLEMKVVLSLMIPKFKYSLPKDKDIRWRMTTITSPIVVGSKGSQMPMYVELAE